MGTAHDYLSAILNRARVPMEPLGFEPDWKDKPRHAKYYPDAERMALPWDLPADPARGGFSLPLLADLLRHSYGQLGRRLSPTVNTDAPELPRYADANWWRGTASGGGLYPVSVYWITGAGGPVLPGVYHYSPLQHEMRRLLTGDVSAEVRSALGELPAAADTDQFLVLGLKFWQNAFKYSSFSYHAVTMDVGTLLHTWQLLAADHGLGLDPVFWFDDERLGALLGVEAESEGVFAVVPLARAASGGSSAPRAHGLRPPAVRYAEQERSRRVRTFPQVTEVHRAAMSQAERPAPTALKGAEAVPPAGERPAVALPPLQPTGMTAHQALRARRSSFGRFSATEPTGAAELGAVLAAAAAAAEFRCDVTTSAQKLARLHVFVNHVREVAAGVYEYDATEHRLLRIAESAAGEFLQPTYFLENYNLEHAGAVIVPTVRAEAVFDAVGDRGYRLVNAVAGAVAQATYTAAAANGLGCGVALGFDNPAYVDELGLADTGEAPLLIMLVGREGPHNAGYRYEIG